MDINDLVLLTILGIGGLIINWNIIKRDFLKKTIKKTSKEITPKKLHVKSRKTIKKKVS